MPLGDFGISSTNSTMPDVLVRGDVLGDVLLELLGRELGAGSDDDERLRQLAGLDVGDADHGHVEHLRVG